MNLLLASTSTVHGAPYLSYLRDEWSRLFAGRLGVFVPYARPGGMSWDDYTARPKAVMAEAGLTVRGVHEFSSVAENGIRNRDRIFEGQKLQLGVSETTMTYHRSQEGDTLTRISERRSVPLDRLLSLNSDRTATSAIPVGELVRLS